MATKKKKVTAGLTKRERGKLISTWNSVFDFVAEVKGDDKLSKAEDFLLALSHKSRKTKAARSKLIEAHDALLAALDDLEEVAEDMWDLEVEGLL